MVGAVLSKKVAWKWPGSQAFQFLLFTCTFGPGETSSKILLFRREYATIFIKCLFNKKFLRTYLVQRAAHPGVRKPSHWGGCMHSGLELGPWDINRLQNPALLLDSCVTLDKLIRLSEPQCLNLQREHTHTFLIGLLQITHKVNLSAHKAPVLATLYLCSGHSSKRQAHQDSCPSLSSCGDFQGTSKTPYQNTIGFSCTSPLPKQKLIKTHPVL